MLAVSGNIFFTKQNEFDGNSLNIALLAIYFIIELSQNCLDENVTKLPDKVDDNVSFDGGNDFDTYDEDHDVGHDSNT